MLSTERITEILDAHKVAEPTRSQILYLTTTDPVRTVAGSRNVRGVFRSIKMDADLQHESRTVERAYLAWCDNNPQVHIILDQPCKITLRRPNGGPPVLYTPDFFVFSADHGAELIETKPTSRLEQLAIEQPWRYMRNETTGKWQSAPAEEASSKLGLKYRIVPDSDIPMTLVRNYEYLRAYKGIDEISSEISSQIAKLKALINNNPGITYADACSQLQEPIGAADALNYAIVRSEVWTDLSKIAIADGRSNRLYASKEIAEIVTQCERADAHKIVSFQVNVGVRFIEKASNRQLTVVRIIPEGIFYNFGDEKTHHESTKVFYDKILSRELLAVEKGQIHTQRSRADEIIQGATSNQLHEADKRFERIRRFVEGSVPRGTKIGRTEYRYLQDYKKAEETLGVGIVGLIPPARPGNRLSKIDDRVAAIIDEEIRTKFLTPNAITKEALWGSICNRCDAHTPPLSNPARRTVYRRINSLSAHKVELARFGSRAALVKQTPLPFDENSLPRYGEHCWAVAHADHTQLDIEVISNNGVNLGRPWLSLLISPKYNRVLARHLTFDPPSYRSNQGLIRDCVERHNQLPERIQTDNGTDFLGNYFRFLLKSYHVHQDFRPPGQPRYGAVQERFNGTLNSRLIHALDGQTRLTKEVRKLVKTHDPKALATMTFAELLEAIDSFFFEVHDTTPHSITGISPRDAFLLDLNKNGLRPSLTIVPDRAFMLATLPTTTVGSAKINSTAGISIHRIDYWNPAFKFHIGERVPVRYDPYDVSTAYAQVGGEWLECRSRMFAEHLRGVTQKERGLFSAMCHSNGTRHEKTRHANAKLLAAFVAERRINPELIQQSAKRREESTAYANSPSTPASTPPAETPPQVTIAPITPPQVEVAKSNLKTNAVIQGSRRNRVYETNIVTY